MRRGRRTFCRRLAGTWLLLTVLLLTGCRASETVAADLPRTGWSGPVSLRYVNRDTLAARELRLFLRLGDRFEQDSLTLRIDLYTPDSLHAVEYHRLVLAESRPTSPLQPVVEFSWRRDAVLPQRGAYYFVLTPTHPVEGAEAVGLRVSEP